MTAPQGHWRIVADGFQGDLNLTADPQGNIHGTVKIDAPNVEQIHGSSDHHSALVTVIVTKTPRNEPDMVFPR